MNERKSGRAIKKIKKIMPWATFPVSPSAYFMMMKAVMWNLSAFKRKNLMNAL